jgi:hypothetical protein
MTIGKIYFFFSHLPALTLPTSMAAMHTIKNKNKI